jgi:tetratricopeptide (TPR) repeat protein
MLATAAFGLPASGQTVAAGSASDGQIEALVVELAHAPTADRAEAIEGRLSDARLHALSPTTLLLLHRAHRESSTEHGHAALSDIDDAIALEPTRAILWRERAAIEASLGNTDQSITDLVGALSRDPLDLDSWAGLAAIAEQTGRYRQAYGAWSHVMQLSPMQQGGAARLAALHHKMLGDPT